MPTIEVAARLEPGVLLQRGQPARMYVDKAALDVEPAMRLQVIGNLIDLRVRSRLHVALALLAEVRRPFERHAEARGAIQLLGRDDWPAHVHICFEVGVRS